MTHWFTNYFSNPAGISIGRRVSSIVLAVVLFFALVLFGVVMVMQLSVFNPDYIASYVDDIDISTPATNWLNENLAPNRPVAAKAAELAINYYEPQIRDRLHSFVYNVYSFFLTRLEQGRLLETVAEQRAKVNDVASNASTTLNAIKAVLDVPALQNLFNSLGIDPSEFGGRININIAQINSFFDLFERAARFQSLIVFVKNFYIPLIIIILALIVGIIFIGRKFRFIAIVLGVTFSLYGIIQLSTLLPLGNYVKTAIANLNLGSLAADTATRFINDVFGTLNIFSAVILFCGLLLIAVYFLTRPRKMAV